MSLSAQKQAYVELKDSYVKRIKQKKKQKKKLRAILILIVIFSFILPNIFYSTYDYLFLRRIANYDIKIPPDCTFLHKKVMNSTKGMYLGDVNTNDSLNDFSFFNKAESGLTNDLFLGKENIGDVSTKAPLMQSLSLSHQMPNLTSRLIALARQNPSIDPGIFIFDYATGNYVDINATKEYPTASIIKLPVLLQLFRRIDQGMANLNNRMTITDYYVTGGSGFLQYKPVGTILSTYELAKKMIQESDNTATNMILSTLGGVNDVDRDLRSWGFSQTHMSNWLPDLDGTNVATPKDLGTMLYNINNPNFLSIESRAQIVELMSHVKNRFLIKASLPDNVQFIHKTGDIGTMLGDAGVVIMPNGKKYIMVVMVKRPWNSFVARQFIIDASKITYDAFVRNDF